MKRLFCLMLATALIASMFVGCSASKTMKDGTYRAEYETADDHGWTDYVEVTVASGKISAVDYDAFDKDDQRKNGNEWYDTAMKDAGSKTWPSDFMPKLEEQLVEKQDVSKIDGVTGATDSTNSFKKLVKELTSSMSKGETATVKVKR